MAVGLSNVLVTSRLHVLLVLLVLSCVSLLSGQQSCAVEGEVRLVGGKQQFEGRLEVCLYNSAERMNVWGTVCNDEWDMNAAQVVCRQLHQQLGVPQDDLSQIVTHIYFGSGGSVTPIHWWKTQCSGTETHLVNCSRNFSVDCGHEEDVGVICSQPSPECGNGDVRILDASGMNSTEGRVELCVGGRWGSICETDWDDENAKVVCRQLGIIDANVPRALTSTQTPQASSSVPIVLDTVGCTGEESVLSDCGSATYIEYCGHQHDIGVNCTHVVECYTEDEVRLAAGSASKGRVEYCKNGLWGTICRNSWDEKDAQVVCAQLGYDGTSLVEYFGLNTEHHDRVYIERADCIGNETALSQCPVRSGFCSMGHGAGVNCSEGSKCDPVYGIRISSGIISNEMGAVEMCFGDWGYVCDDEWDDRDAEVVCRQLGLTGGVALTMGKLGPNDTNYLIDNVQCDGSENSLDVCVHNGVGVHDCRAGEHASVICGTSQGSPLNRCMEEDENKTVIATETTMKVGSLGVCERYAGLSEHCNGVFNGTSDYVFFNQTLGNQKHLSDSLDTALNLLEMDSNECFDLIRSVICNYIFAPCGSNGTVHIPRSVCSEECNYVRSACSSQWNIIDTVLDLGLGSINCSNTSSRLTPLTTCCIGVGIEIKELTTSPSTTGGDDTASTTGRSSVGDQSGTIAGAVIGLLMLLLILFIIIAVIVCCVVTTRRRKATIRSLQLDVLGSPTRMPLHPLGTDFLMIDGKDLDSPMDVKLRRNGAQTKGPYAVPNPYATKQEYDQQAPLLSPTAISMANRISSSIIRELTSNMLIPYTRLKLLDCVGQGEFGVVYKAHYTEPEGDIGYKTSTVAVKTLKGFFDQNQVNKIMEESIKMKHFDHPNVLNLVGVCLDAGPAPYVVMPYMANGSLLHYLKKERPNLVLPVGTDEDVRFEVCKRLTVMCMQISSGMEYLAHEKFIHRDLAARNCMIDIHFVIKIADFGLSEDVYAKNYFRQTGSDKSTKLPVKWMAPECLTDGIFSEKSDVWSFGITCWEIFSGGKTPYPGVDPMSLSHMLETDRRLSRPLNVACSDEMYQIMKKCWDKSPEKRPGFENLADTISEYAEKIAGYLDINSYNPFTATYTEIQDSSDDQNKTITTPEKLIEQMNTNMSKQRSPRASPKASPRQSPRGSPRITPNVSPRITPNVSPRITPSHSPCTTSSFLTVNNPSTASSVGIEIRVQSPSEVSLVELDNSV